MKVCRACERERPESEYYKQGKGLALDCKECYKAKVRAHRAENIEEVRAKDRARGRTEKRKQRVRDNAHKYKDRRTEYVRRHRAKNPKAYQARTAVGNAIRDGRLTRKPCEVCGAKAQAHHEDYDKPLDVRWLCPEHHGLVHRQD